MPANIYTDSLTNLGLSLDQAQIYISLLEHGPQTASQLSSSTSVKRTYVYNLTATLLKLGLVTQQTKGKTTLFSASNPQQLQKLAADQEARAKQASATLDSLLPSLNTQFASHETKPVITYYDGLEGLKKVYADINQTRQDIILFRSIYDHNHPQLESIILKQIDEQVKNNIHVKTISPLEPDYTQYTYLALDPQRLVERHIIDPNFLNLPAQVIVYGQKVAFTSFKTQITSMVIDNPDIASSLKDIFEYMWTTSQAQHDKYSSSWTEPGPNPYTKPVPNLDQRNNNQS